MNERHNTYNVILGFHRHFLSLSFQIQRFQGVEVVWEEHWGVLVGLFWPPVDLLHQGGPV